MTDTEISKDDLNGMAALIGLAIAFAGATILWGLGGALLVIGLSIYVPYILQIIRQ